MGFTLYQTSMLPGIPDKLVIEQDNITIGDLFQLLLNQYGNHVLKDILDGEHNLSSDAMIILNGKIIKSQQTLMTVIPPKSELLITVLIAGG